MGFPQVRPPSFTAYRTNHDAHEAPRWVLTFSRTDTRTILLSPAARDELYLGSEARDEETVSKKRSGRPQSRTLGMKATEARTSAERI